MKKSKEQLNEEIEYQLTELRTLDAGSEEQSRAVENVVKLTKLKNDDKNQIIDLVKECLKIGVPAVIYIVFLRKGFRFEETGAFTSTTFRNLIGRMNPFK